MPKLESEVLRSIRALCEHADTLVSMGESSFAISKYYEALSLIPDPKKDYKAATWIYTSIGETYWKQNDYNNAGMAFLKAVKSVGGDKIARVNLRLGECLYECGESVHSTEYLCQAYMLEGEDAFSDEDPKYFAAIRPEVEGAPDDDDFDEDYGKNDYYLVDNMLGGSPRPAEYDGDMQFGEIQPEDEPEDPEELDTYDEYGRDYYAQDIDVAEGDEEYGYDDDDASDYFDGGGDDDIDYDDDYDDEYGESFIVRIKNAFQSFLGLFK